jgi:hypothetical protein
MQGQLFHCSAITAGLRLRSENREGMFEVVLMSDKDARKADTFT